MMGDKWLRCIPLSGLAIRESPLHEVMLMLVDVDNLGDLDWRFSNRLYMILNPVDKSIKNCRVGNAHRIEVGIAS